MCEWSVLPMNFMKFIGPAPNWPDPILCYIPLKLGLEIKAILKLQLPT